ncbi:FAD-binding protein [Pseudodesulfovibrio pelocollis]|uniref:FAD-binding protein n=1 Tax=Pseudodesulfovibrio pelocollis TaxID=3051432 RepID=UPI00255B03E6|nr:FAD-binding protein [Pseudodesulfovibrio sp. SB368]
MPVTPRPATLWPPNHVTTDILVLGSGLAGLRAAWAAAEANPSLTVTVVRAEAGPTGSSFANRNNALGIQLPDTDARRAAFCAEVLALGDPGLMDPALVAILAEEAEARVRELSTLDLRFRQTDRGARARFPGCGSLEARALIFDDLLDAFNQFYSKTISCGVAFLNGVEILGILTNDGAAWGAWGVEMTTGEPMALRGRAVIMALGGPAPLFARHQAGRGSSGLGLGMLADAGVLTANEPYLQFMWGRENGAFLTPARLLGPGNRLMMPESVLPDASLLDPSEAVGQALNELRAARALHCPAFHHRPQAVLDRLLLRGLHPDGLARVITPGGEIRAGLFAHAGNGGAVVDEHGATTLSGLFAVGECATGMHGANRLGGAMVLATQVFGRRAGLGATQYAAGAELMDPAKFDQCYKEVVRHVEASEEGRLILQTIAHGLSLHALFGGTPGHGDGLKALRADLAELARSSDRRVRLAALGGLLVSRPTGDAFQADFWQRNRTQITPARQ